jgi:hypothetical protein
MNDKSAGQDRTLWGKVIKQHMVTVRGTKSTYRLNDKKNGSVEIHYGAGPLKVPSGATANHPKRNRPWVKEMRL